MRTTRSRRAKATFPSTHLVPPATGPMTAEPVGPHSPICKPSGEQTIWPGVQPPELDPAAGAGAGAGAGAAGGATEGAAAGAADGDGEARMVAVPGEAGAGAAGAGAGAAAEGAAAGAAPEPDDEEAEEPAAPHLGPVGGLRLWLVLTSDWPGSGNCTSDPSVVVQSVAGTLATNISGKVASARETRLKSAAWVPLRLASSSAVVISGITLRAFFPPPVTTMGAQFMYISRLPLKLNQVQASA